jgi:hypothetical protein
MRTPLLSTAAARLVGVARGDEVVLPLEQARFRVPR